MTVLLSTDYSETCITDQMQRQAFKTSFYQRYIDSGNLSLGCVVEGMMNIIDGVGTSDHQGLGDFSDHR